jgi:hypothetical protein
MCHDAQLQLTADTSATAPLLASIKNSVCSSSGRLTAKSLPGVEHDVVSTSTTALAPPSGISCRVYKIHTQSKTHYRTYD